MLYFPDFVSMTKDNLDAESWYADASLDIARLCLAENWDRDRFTAILALTSPRCSVRRNVRLALHYMHTGQHMSTVLAVRQSLAKWESTGRIDGPKVEAFRKALSGHVNAIVLDVHMANLFNVPQSQFSRAKKRAHWERLVCLVADKVGIWPRDAQACLWFAWRRHRGERPAAFPVRQEYANWLAHNRRFPSSGPIPQFADGSGHYQPSLWRV